MIKPNATDASKNRLANVGTGKVARTEDYLANIGDLPTYYYEKYKNANNKYFDSNMWSIAAQRGELDILTSAINRNTEDLNNNLYNETFDNLQQNFAGMYDYDTYMLALEYPYLNNTIKKTRSDAETGTVFGDYTDKEWADYIFENATERFAAMQLEEKKANANGFLKAINSILASFWEVGAGATEFFSDLYNIFQGLSVEEYIRNGIRTGEWNYINHFREAFVDEDGVQIISTGLSNAIYEFERQNTDMVNAVDAADAGYALGEGSNWIEQVYRATNAGSSYTTIGKFLAFGGEAIGYMLPTIGLGIATGGASTAAGSGTNIFGKIAAFFKPNLSNGLFYAGILSGNYKENLNTYLSKGGTLEEFNGFEGMTNAFLKTSFEYVIEKALSLALGATLLDRLIGTAVGKTGAKTAEKIITNASKKGASAFGKAATRLTKDAAKEGLEELLQDLSNDMWDLAYNGFYKERGLDNLTLQNLVDAFLIGAMVSGTISSIRNLKYVPSKNRGTIVTDKGEIVSMGYFQTLNYNEAMRVISEWYSTTQDANASKEEKENAAMKLAIAIDTLGSVFNAIGDNRTLIANKVLVETYKQKEEVDKYTKLPDAEYAAKLVDEWYKNQSKLFIDYLNKKLGEKEAKKKEREENQPTIVKKLRNLFTKNAKELKNAGVTKIDTAITESKSINEGISNVSPELAQAFSDAAKMVNKDNKLGVIVVSGKNRRLAIRSEDIVVLSKEELNALATDKSAFAASIALKSAVTTLKAKIKEAGALKLIVNEYIRVSGTKVEKAKDKDALIDDAVVLLMTSPKFYTTMLLRCGEISGDGKVNRLALLKVLTTMNQIIDGKLAVALNKGSVAKDIYDNIMKKARENMRAGLIIYATQYINLDTGNISNDVLDSNTKSYLSNNLKYEKNVRFTESINEIKKESDIGALNEKYIAQYKRDLERCIQNLAMFYPEYIPVFNSISEDCINQISSDKARDREEAIAVLIFLSDTFVRNSEISKSTFAKEKVTYLPMNIDAGSYLFNREIIRNVEMFFGPNYTIDRLISGKMTVDNDSTKLTEEAKNFIKVNGYDITNRESMINCVSTVLSNMSGGALLLGADGTVLCSLTADEFLKAEYAKNPLLIYDRVKSGEVTLVGELKIPDLIIPEKLSNCGLKIYDFGADSNTVAAYDIENDIIYINSNKSKFSVVPFLHELTHATQKMTGDIVKDPITGDKNVLMQTGANKIYFKNFDAKTKAEIKKHIKENAPLFYRTVTALKPANEKDFIETIGYLNVRGELQAKTFGPHTLVDYGFTFRKDLKTNQLYLVGFDHKTEWLINTKPKGSTIAAIEKIAKSKSTVIKKAVKSTAEEALESGAKAEEDKENVAAKAEVTTTKTKKKTKEAKPVTTKPVAETVEAAKPVATKKKKTKEAKPTTETVEAAKPVATKKKKKKTTDSEQLSMFDSLNLDLNIDLTSKKNRDDLAKATYDFMHEKGTPALVTADNTPIVMFRGAEENEFENLGENKIYDNTGYRTKFNEFYTNSYTLADMYNKSTFKERSSNVKKIQGYVFNYTKDEILPLDVKGGSWHLIQLFRFERKYTDILDTYRRGLIGKRDIPEGALTIFKLTDGYNRIMDIKKRFSPKYETDFTAFEPTYNDVLYDYITQNSFDKQSLYDKFDSNFTYDTIMKLYADGIVSFNDISHNGVEMTKEDFSKLRNIVFERINNVIDYIDDLHKNIGLSKLQIAKIMYSIIPSGNESYKYVHFETLEDENRDIYGFSTNDTAIIAALSGYKAIVIKNVEDLPKRVTEVTNDEETKFAGVSLYRLNTVFINLESNRQLKVTKSKKSAVNNFTYLDETINSYLLDLSQKELLEYYSIIAKRKDINHTTKYNSKSSIVTSTPKTKNLFAKEREYTLYDYVSKYIYRAAEDVYNGRLTSNLAKKLNKGLKSNYGISLLDSYFVTPEGDSLLKTHRFKEKGVDNKVSMYDNALENNEILIQASNNLVGVNNVATDDGWLTNTQLLDKEEIEEAFEVYIENFKNSLSSIKDLLNNDGIFDTNEKENIIKDLDKIVDNKINYNINYVLLNDKNISKNIKHLFDKLRRLRIELDANNNYRPIDYYKIIPSMYDKYLNPILNNYVSALKLLVPNNRTETRKLLNRINYYLSLLHLSYESKDILSDLSNNSRDRHTYEYTNFDEIFVPKKKNKGPGSKPSAKGKQYVGEKNRLDTRATGNFGITKKRKNTEGYLTTKKLKGGVEKTYAVPSRHYVNTADVEKYPHMKAYRGMLIDESVYDMLKNVDYDKLGNKLKALIDSATLNIQSVIQFVRETAKMNNYEFELLVKYFFNNNAALLRIANIARKKYDTEEAYYKDTKVLDIVREKLLKNASDIAAMAYMLTNGGVNTSLFIAAGGTRSKKGKTNTQLSELEKALLKLRLEDLREIKIADILTPKGELDDKKFKALSKSLVDKGMSEKKANEVIFKYKDITLGELIDSNIVYDKNALSLTEMGILYNLLSSNPSFAMLLKGATNKIRRNTGEDYQYDTEVDYTSLQLLAFKMYDGTINSIREFYNYATSIQHLIDTSSEEATDAEGKTIKREGGVSNFYLPKAIIDFDKVTEEEKEEQKEILTLDEEDKKLLFLFKKVIHKEHIDNTEGAYIAKFIRKEKLNEILTDKYNEFGVNQADGMSYGETETELLTREAVSDTEKWLKSNLTSVGNIKKYFVEYMKKSVTYEKAKARKLAKEGKIELRSKSGVENKKERNRLISQIDKRLYRFVNILNSFESKKAYERLVASYPELKEYIVPVNDAQNQFGVKRKFSTVLTIEELVSLDKLTSKVFSSWSKANTNIIGNRFKNTEKKGSERKKAFEEKMNTEGQSGKKSSEPTGSIIIEHKYNYKSFDDFADSDDNIPNLVKQLLATRYKTNRKTEVKGFSNNLIVESLNGKHFISENRDALGNADQHEIIEAMNWFINNQKYNTIGFVDPEDSRRFIAHMFYFAEYVLYVHKKGIITLTKEMLDAINDLLRPYLSLSGTLFAIHSQFAEKIDPFREFVQDLEIDGIPLSEAEENEMYLALESNNFEKIMEVRTKIVNRIAAEKGDKKPLTRTIAAYRSMAMLSSPMTWLRNFVSNYALKYLNKLADRIGKILFKNKHEESQINLDIKPTKEVLEYIQKMFIDTKFFDTILSNLNKYSLSEMNVNRTVKRTAEGKITREEIMLNLILKSMYGEYYNQHAFNNKIANQLHGLLMKMLSDDKFVRAAALEYFAKILTARQYNLDTNEISDSVMNDFAISVGQALRDYMHSDNVFNKVEKYISERTELGWFAYKMIMPFASASWEWFKAALRVSPLGLAKAIFDISRLTDSKTGRKGLVTINKEKWLSGSTNLPPELTEHIVRRNLGLGTIGTVAYIFGAILAAVGIIGLEDDDYGTPKLRVFDLEVDVSSIFGTSPLLAGAALITAFNNEDGFTFENLIEGLNRTSDVIVDGLPLMTLIEFDMYQNGTWSSIWSYLENTATSFIPNILAWVGNLTYSGTFKTTNVFERAAVKVPFLNTAMDVFGWIRKKTDPYTGESGSYLDNINRFVPYISIVTRSNQELMSKANGLTRSELNGHYVINDEKFDVTGKELEIVNSYYGKWNAKDLAKFYNNQMKVTVKSNNKYYTLSYNQMTSEQRKKAISTIMSNNAELAKILAWIRAGHKYSGSETIYSKLRARGITTNISKGTKGYVK